MYSVTFNPSWQFNSTNEFRDVAEENVIVDGAVSVVSYVPRDESDYGTLLCWGRNELGRQRRPCVFHVIPAGEEGRETRGALTPIPLFPKERKAEWDELSNFPASRFIPTLVKMCSTLMRYIGAIKACESQFLQMVIALLWVGLGRRRLSCFPNCSKLCWAGFSSGSSSSSSSSTSCLLLLLSS